MSILTIQNLPISEDLGSFIFIKKVNEIPFSIIVPYFPLLSIQALVQEVNKWKISPAEEIFS